MTVDIISDRTIKHELCSHPKGKNFIDIYYGEKILFCEKENLEYYKK